VESSENNINVEQKDNTPDKIIARPPVEPVALSHEPGPRYTTVLGEFWSLITEIRTYTKRRYIYLFSGGIIGVLLLNMVGQVYLNRWQGAFFRSIEKKDLSALGNDLLIFLPLVLLLLAIVVSQTWLHERLKISLREWLSHSLLDKWLAPARAYRLAITSTSDVNPDQRIQEDTRNFCEMSADLGVGLAQASLLLISFIGVLWGMSAGIHFEIRGTTVHIPGYMVWVAIIYSIGGSWITSRVGKPLIKLNESRYTREANFRFSIVRVNENSESIGFYGGEKDERRILNQNLISVLNVMKVISTSLARLTWITSGYGWLMIVLPVLVALPGYLQGALDLGGLMMVVGAFNQVQQSLRWFVDSFARIADWRAALYRIIVFRDALNFVDMYENEQGQIELLSNYENKISFEHTKINLIDGAEVIADATAHIMPGERVLLEGPSGSGKSTLFRAIVGLWPWGSGKIFLPLQTEMMFLPQRPYMPPGTLAEILKYPYADKIIEEEKLTAALKRVNLEEFIHLLHTQDRWDKLMSLGQQQRVAFARLLIHKPQWVFLDEATSALDENNEDKMMAIFNEELKDSSVLSIGHRPSLTKYHQRRLQLIPTTKGTVLKRKNPPASQSTWKRLTNRMSRLYK
jgi:putative ATP-binding cassette transporter